MTIITNSMVEKIIDQIQLHILLSKLFLILSLPTYFVTRYIIVAPFGRHVPEKDNWWLGFKCSARLSWFFFECPNLIWSWYYSASIIKSNGEGSCISTNGVLLFLFTLHYIHRDIIYPLRMNSNSQKVPLLVTIAAGLITTWNGFLQCFYLAQIKKDAPLTLQVWLGIGLFFLGMGINLHSDGVLRNLRRKNNHQLSKSVVQKERYQENEIQHAYYIPHSPLFSYISCPNFFGEILEWFGFAMASHFSLPSVAFFIYTASNLIPRGIAHHHWYQRKFDDYPVERRWAVVPFFV